MKLLILTLALFAQPALTAQKVDLLLCNDTDVVLSRTKIPCKGELHLPDKFDIPQLRINIEHIKKIFLGAESSGGGRVVAPANMRTVAPTRPSLPYPIKLNCEARLVSDGGKRVSFLSLQDFKLNQYLNSTMLNKTGWAHFLMEGNSLYPAQRFAVSEAPAINIDRYSVTVNYTEGKKPSILLTVCENNLSESTKSFISSCSEALVPHYTHYIGTRLVSMEISKEENLKIKKTLQVQCHIH